MSEIFVFGSNLAGRHGRGSALQARKYHGAIDGLGIGRMGNSYAIPTKNHRLQTLPLDVIETHVRTFLEYAATHHYNTFNVVAIGCGLAGYSAHQITPMFADYPRNVKLPSEFLTILYHTGQWKKPA